MHIVIRHEVDTRYELMATTFVGSFETPDEASWAIAHDAKAMEREWGGDDEGARCAFDAQPGEYTLYAGDAFDHDLAAKWLVFDDTNPGKRFAY